MSISGLAARAYQEAAGIAPAAPRPPDAAGAGADNFSALLGRTLQDAVAGGHAADTQAAQALSGHGDLTQVVTAVSRAELTLQTAVALRDRVVQAYQDIIRMPI